MIVTTIPYCCMHSLLVVDPSIKYRYTHFIQCHVNRASYTCTQATYIDFRMSSLLSQKEWMRVMTKHSIKPGGLPWSPEAPLWPWRHRLRSSSAQYTGNTYIAYTAYRNALRDSKHATVEFRNVRYATVTRALWKILYFWLRQCSSVMQEKTCNWGNKMGCYINHLLFTVVYTAYILVL